MNYSERAVETYQSGFSCAQSVFATYAETLGLDREIALRNAAAFGGGMGRLGEVCGALTGAFMALGLRYGSVNPEDKESKEQIYRLVQELAARFRERHGTILCRELVGCDLNNPEEARIAREQGVFKTRCGQYVRDAAEILEGMV